MNKNKYISDNAAIRTTALWAFSEAAFGGILHAARIPLTGLFIGGSAVIFLSMLYYQKREISYIWRSTLTVIVIKGMVSPHTPLTAYSAILIQGVIAAFFFKYFGYRIAALLTGFVSLTLFGFQKIIILTLLFGMTLWESVTNFASFILTQFGLLRSSDDYFDLSLFIIAVYVSIHSIGGIIFGFISGKIPSLLDREDLIISIKEVENNKEILSFNKNKTKIKWYKRKSTIAIIIFFGILLLFSYLFNGYFEDSDYDVIFMLIRSTIILFVWFKIAAPFVHKLIKKILAKRKNQFSEDITIMMDLFPEIRKVFSILWKNTQNKKLPTRFRLIFINLLYYILK
ncbi:MAG: hypothetical protein K8F36_02300 [Melioribacteraceae bacterium]|nr:hypothetical protein [Melioribacteraceae bacterium]MCO6473901.1 hypothetical protein [Melioribacteraceae bacterium]MDD3558541.1 hypothetical protein [Melioribacteraceae bacterium]